MTQTIHQPEGPVQIPDCLTYEEFLAWCPEDVHAEWVNGRVELMSPRSGITAILSLLPRCTMTSRNDGVGSSKRGPVPKRRNALAARTRLKNTLAHNATARKILRQPSFRSDDMTGQTGGEQSRAQGETGRGME